MGGSAGGADNSPRKALFDNARAAEQTIELEERVVEAWQERLQPYLVANTDVLPQAQFRSSLGREEYEPV